MFSLYLKLGFDHILDFGAYDHILFVMVLCAIYSIAEWQKILILVTAFTIGHSLTLALSVFQFIKVPSSIIETLIPLTIILTGVLNLVKAFTGKVAGNLTYSMALFFGLIHGMGFSNYLNILLGSHESKTIPLFAFNLGVEVGQIIIVASTLSLSYFIVEKLRLNLKIYSIFISTIAILVAALLLNK